MNRNCWKYPALCAVLALAAALLGGCGPRSAPPEKSPAGERRPQRQTVAEKAPRGGRTAPRAGAQGRPAPMVFADSLGAVTNLCYRPDYAQLYQRACYAPEVVAAGLEKEPGNADLHFVLGLRGGDSEAGGLELQKACECDPLAPYPRVELLVWRTRRGEADKAVLAVEELAPCLEDQEVRRTLRRKFAWLLENYYWNNRCVLKVGEYLGNYDGEVARLVARQYAFSEQERDALRVAAAYIGKARNDREKEAWLEILEGLGGKEAERLRGLLVLEGERSPLSQARGRLNALALDVQAGRVSWFGEELMKARYAVLELTTNAAERRICAREFVMWAMENPAGSALLEEYAQRISSPGSKEEYEEFGALLGQLAGGDRGMQASILAQTALLQAPPERRARLLAEIVGSGVKADPEIMAEVVAANPDSVPLLRAVARDLEDRGEYAAAAESRRRLLDLVRTEGERREAVADLGRCLAAGQLTSELNSLLAAEQESLLEQGGLPGQITYWRLLMARGETNAAWQSAAELFCETPGGEERAALLGFLLEPDWSRVPASGGLAAALTEAALARPIPQGVGVKLEELRSHLYSIRAGEQVLEVVGAALEEGYAIQSDQDIIRLFKDKQTAMQTLLEWLRDCKAGPQQAQDFFTSLAWNLGEGELQLEYCSLVWNKFREELGRFPEKCFHCYLNALSSDLVPKEVRERHGKALLNELLAAFAAGDAGRDSDFYYKAQSLWSYADEAQRREIWEGAKRDALAGGLRNNYMYYQYLRLADTPEKRQELEEIYDVKYSRENLMADPGLLPGYLYYRRNGGGSAELVKEVLEGQTNLVELAKTRGELLWLMDECGMKERADEVRLALLEDATAPWYVRENALSAVKNPALRREKMLEVAESMPDGSGKNQLYQQLMRSCSGEEDREVFVQALEYLEGSTQEYVWEDLFRHLAGCEYDIDAERVFGDYEALFAERMPADKLQERLAENRLEYYRERGDYAQAIPQAERLLESAQDRGNAVQSLADLYVRNGEPEKAAEAYEDLLKRLEEARAAGDLSREDWGRTAIAGLKELALRGEATLDLDTVEKAMLGQKPTLDEYRSFLDLSSGLMSWEDTGEYFEKALALAVDDRSKGELLGEWSQRAQEFGDTNACLRIMKQRLETDPSTVGEYIGMLSACGQTGEAVKTGLAAWENLGGENKSWRRNNLRSQLCDLCLEAGDKDSAWKVLESAWSPDAAEYGLDYRRILQQAKKLDREEEALKSLVERADACDETWARQNGITQLCNILRQEGREEETRALADRFAEDMASGAEKSPQGAQLLLSSSHPELGLEYVRDCVQNGRKDEYMLNVAMEYFRRQNDPDGARAYLETLPEGYARSSAQADLCNASSSPEERAAAARALKECLAEGELERYQKSSLQDRLVSLAVSGEEKDRGLIAELANDFRTDQSLGARERSEKLLGLYEGAQDYGQALNVCSEWLMQARRPEERREARERYASMLESAGRPQEAANLYRELVQSARGDDDRDSARERLISIYAKSGDGLAAQNIRRERIAECQKALATIQYGPRAEELRRRISEEQEAIDDNKDFPKGQ